MNTLLKILTLTICTVNCFAQDNKESAKSFFKSIVKTYFDKDMFFQSLSENFSKTQVFEKLFPFSIDIKPLRVCDDPCKNGNLIWLFKPFANSLFLSSSAFCFIAKL